METTYRNMETTIQPWYGTKHSGKAVRSSMLTRYLTWCDNQEKNRLGWLAIALAGHGCMLTPITLFAIILSGNLFVLWILAIVAMSMCLVTNLAALPTKITIPIFMFSVVVDLVIIAYALVTGLSMSGTYI